MISSLPAPSAGPGSGTGTLAGTVVAIPAVTYGANAAQTPLAGAVVIAGPVLVLGATPPPVVPPGDVAATTDANGAFALTIASPPIAPTAAQAAFVLPLDNVAALVPPASGYYVAVFAPGADGVSAGAPLPVHAFSSATGGRLATARVSNATADEAAFLALLNRDRSAANPAAPALRFDENAEEAARLHAADEAAQGYFCHYNAQNAGPQTRYLRLGGLGSDGENIGLAAGTPQAAYAFIEAAFLAEGPAGGPHFANIVDPAHRWAGVAAAGAAQQDVDQELISPQAGAPDTYPAEPTCPTGVTANGS